MQIEKTIKHFLVFSGDGVLEAMQRISDNKSRIVFVVQDNGVLIGALSDGDIRRWITSTPELNLDAPVDAVMNKCFVACRFADANAEVDRHFENKRDIIPLTDEQGRFVAIARRSKEGLQIGERFLTHTTPSFIIAEVGNNHNGDPDLAKRLVDHAVEAKADCVKFQMRHLADLYSNRGKRGEAGYDLGSQYTLELLHKFQLENEQLFDVFEYCREHGILPLCTPWDLQSVKVLEAYGLEGYKVASADFTNFELLEALAATGKPVICSTGMCSETEIKGSVALLRRLKMPYALLHCNSTYPTPYKDVNLSYLSRLKEIAGSIVGYSGHERGFVVPLAAVAMGARIVEKHITVDRGMEGNDHKVSLLPEEFAEMVRQIRNLEEAMGEGGERQLTQGEMINRENLAKSLVINCDLTRGQTIQRRMIVVKSPGQGLQPNRVEDLVGKAAKRNFKRGDFFFESDVSPQFSKKSSYHFSRPYGIPVRYHDYATLIEGVHVDFTEFHLSYHDLDLNLSEYFSSPQQIGYAVHSPELFAGDHILDLASDDVEYRNLSIKELSRTIATTANLQKYFPATLKPALVLNAGGWTRPGFLPMSAREKLYDRIAAALEEIDLTSVQLAIQTMPPFPWHFGGQSHHNLFVDPDEIVAFCTRTGHHICLDVSHSMMSCNYYKWDFSEFLEEVLPFTVHLHIADAKGVDGEGVQIGHGDVDFEVLQQLLQLHAPNVPFIPEVWQGHKDNGEGFWAALGYLETVGL
jgi:sialic acid synthase SpsE/sugar phosphate isomerase/epimerase